LLNTSSRNWRSVAESSTIKIFLIGMANSLLSWTGVRGADAMRRAHPLVYAGHARDRGKTFFDRRKK
jgi:hypothetical protein